MGLDSSATESTIVDLRAHAISVPIGEPVRLSFGTLDKRRVILVEVELADGTVGYGESWVNWPPWAHAERLAAYSQGLRPMIVGRDARDIDRIRADLEGYLYPMGRQAGAGGPAHQALSGIDLALWDLAGKLSGCSAANLCGGSSGRVGVYASSIGPGPNAEAVCRQVIADGFSTVKLRVGFGREQDRDLLERVRSCLGDRITLIADANRAWTLAEAEEMCGILGEYSVGLIEEPLVDPDLRDFERLHDATGLEVAVGENLYEAEEFSSHLASRAIGALQPDVTKNGGFTFVRSIGEMASARGVPLMPHCYGGPLGFFASVHLMAGSGFPGAVEFPIGPSAPFWEMAGGAPEVRDGWIEISSGSGFGFLPGWKWMEANGWASLPDLDLSEPAG